MGKLARFLAPIALAAVAVGVYLIVHSSPLVSPASSSTTTAAIVSNRRESHHAHPKPHFYIVKPGDTLSGIAARTGVPLTRLSALNPSVAQPPYNLQAGQRLRLRR
ncbi:MAG: LysM domain-containing protein [Solirubrobacteraceae bacterium]